MSQTKDLQLLLRARYPIICIESADESGVLNLLTRAAIGSAASEYRAIYRWSLTDSLQRLDIEMAPQPHNADPADLLGHIKAVKQPGIYALLDFHPFLDDPRHVRMLKDICLTFDDCSRHIIFVGHEIELPAELKPFSTSLELRLPNENERLGIVRDVAQQWSTDNAGKKVSADEQALGMLVRNLAGLPMDDTRRLASNAIYDDGVINHDDMAGVMSAKYKLLDNASALQFEYETAAFDDIGGMRALKRWLLQRKPAFSGDQNARHLDPPKGILLIGVQGCGKSLAAKATASAFDIPLLRLDFATLYNKFHGETERNLRDALKTAGSMAPCVLWIDELEKGLASGNDNSGTSKRILGSFLTWMAERPPGVFVVATANDISALPPEMVRKGRFDEIFFVDLPKRSVRKDIFSLHLADRSVAADAIDLDALAQATRGFSGAEIEQLVVAGLYRAYAKDEPLGTKHLLHEAKATKPLSVTMAESVDALRQWARVRAVASD